MRTNDELTLFLSVLKWLLISTIVGCVAGLGASTFIRFIHFVIEQGNRYEHVFYLLPLSFFLANLLSQFVLKRHLGTDEVIAAINKNYGKLEGSFIPTKVVNVVLILATGGSAGKESPCAQIGAGIGSAYQVSSALGVTFFYYPLKFVPAFGQGFFLKLMAGGIFFGLCAYGMIWAIRNSTRVVTAIPIWRPLKGLLGGAVLVGLTLLFSRDYLGLGLNLMESCVRGVPVVSYAFLLKALFTIITLSISRSGSVITPILFIGATAGSFFGDLVGADRATFAAIGFVSLLAGTTNTPIATSILAIELFGAAVAPYAAVSCVISFLMSGHQSLWPRCWR